MERDPRLGPYGMYTFEGVARHGLRHCLQASINHARNSIGITPPKGSVKERDNERRSAIDDLEKRLRDAT